MGCRLCRSILNIVVGDCSFTCWKGLNLGSSDPSEWSLGLLVAGDGREQSIPIDERSKGESLLGWGRIINGLNVSLA